MMPGRPDLRPHTEEIARRLLGQPNERLSTRGQLRFGTNGSVAVEITGPKQGDWYDHENQVGGGPWQLLTIKGRMANGIAIEWLRSEIGIEIATAPRIVATYDYRDERGELLFRVVRFVPKDFRQCRPDGNGGWIWSVKGTRQVPYRLPEVLTVPPGAYVYIVEGEKDADRLAGLGLVATCNAGGAAKRRANGKSGKPKWRPELNPFFRGLNPIIVCDNDAAGRDHALSVAANLAPVAARVRILDLPGLPPKGDVSDWLDAGGTREVLERLAAEAPDSRHEAISNTSNGVPGTDTPIGDVASAPSQHLDIGSDVEIAKRVARDLRNSFGEVVFCDGDFWHYNGLHWQPIDYATARRAVHLYDGAVYQTPAGEPAAVKLSKGRIDSALNEMGAVLNRPDFFAAAPVGINCASGFIAFEACGEPQLSPHDPDHRCRHVLPGRWQPGSDAEDPPPDSLLGRLLGGAVKGDDDEAEKRKFVAEIAGAAALGYATKLRQPKAIVLKGEKAENGKSQILELFRGGSAAIASDTFKAVVTGEPVSGRDVYRSAITFRPAAQHVFATNTLPTFKGGMDRGVQRRLGMLTFNRVIPIDERVEHIGLRVGAEEPNLLLAWAVGGASRLLSQRGFTNPESSKLALRDWLYGADPVLAWTEVRVRERDPARGGYKSGHAHAMFKEWALASGFRDSTIPAVNGFVQRLQANVASAIVKHTKSGNWLRGIEILLQDQKDDVDAAG